ncbi:MAG: response regulator [Myxococcota bacterium]
MERKSGRARVLVVNAELDTQAALNATLRKRGFWVETLSDPERALSVVRSGECELVVVDVAIELNGRALVEVLVQSQPGLPVIMTGTVPDSAPRPGDRELRAIVPKPKNDLEYLADTVEVVLGTAKRRRQTHSSLRRIRASLANGS